MKAVLMSIQPKWCEKIANGEKTIEVRKTSPKLGTPFKCYIYCTIGNGVKGDYLVPSGIQCGKVIGEFVCDKIAGEGETIRGCTGLSMEELQDYCNGKDIYGWHISDTKIYDKPKELSEFRLPCTKKKCASWCKDMKINDKMVCENKNKRFITRPPQSWCYVEELQNG